MGPVDVVIDASNASDKQKLESQSLEILKRGGHFVSLQGDLLRLSDTGAHQFTTLAGPALASLAPVLTIAQEACPAASMW
jgi:hypothetical protein